MTDNTATPTTAAPTAGGTAWSGPAARAHRLELLDEIEQTMLVEQPRTAAEALDVVRHVLERR